MQQSKFALRHTLSSCAIAFALCAGGSEIAYAQCVTSGSIAASCNATSDTTGAITIGPNGPTMTILSNITLADTIDDNDATPDAAIATAGSGLTITQDGAIGDISPLSSVTIADTDTWDANADITATDLRLNGASTININGTASVYANITGSISSGTITINSTGTVGTTGNAIDLKAGSDTIAMNAAATIDADTLDGGNGTDEITINGADAVINSDISNFEDITIETANTLTIGGSVDDVDFALSEAGTALIINASGETITGTFVGTDGSDSAQTFTLTDGTVSGNIIMYDGADTISLNGGNYSGNVLAGEGDDTINLAISMSGRLNGGDGTDVLNITGTASISDTITNIETINLGSNSLTTTSSITGIGTANDTGIDIANGTLIINSGGSVTGAIHSTGTGTLNFGANNLGGTFTLGGIVEDVALTLTSGTLNTSTYNAGGNSALGDVTIATGSTLNLATDITSSGAFSNAGTISISTTSNIIAATQTEAAGSYTINIDHDLNHGDILINSGDVNLSTATFTVATDTAAQYTEAQAFLIADGTTTVNGGTGLALTQATDNSFFWDFYLADGASGGVSGADDTNVYLITAVENTVDDVATTQNNANAANTIRDLQTSTDATFQTVIDTINGVQSADELNRRAEALQPTNDSGYVTGSIAVSQKTFDLVRTRLATIKTGRAGIAAGDNYEKPSHIWGRAFATHATQEMRDGIDGYATQTQGVTIGADKDITDHLTLGAAVTYANTRVKSDNINQTTTDINSYQASLYSDYDITKRAFVTTMIGYNGAKNNSERLNIAGINGLNAKADFSSSQFVTRSEIGYNFYTNKGLTITPSVNANYVYYTADEYTETGAAGAGLNVKTDDISSLEFGGAVEFSAIFKKPGSPELVKPKLRLGYRHDVIGDKLQSSANYIGDTTVFKTEGFSPAQDTYELGLGVDYFKLKKWSLSLDYNAEFKEDYLSHQAAVQARYPL